MTKEKLLKDQVKDLQLQVKNLQEVIDNNTMLSAALKDLLIATQVITEDQYKSAVNITVAYQQGKLDTYVKENNIKVDI